MLRAARRIADSIPDTSQSGHALLMLCTIVNDT